MTADDVFGPAPTVADPLTDSFGPGDFRFDPSDFRLDLPTGFAGAHNSVTIVYPDGTVEIRAGGTRSWRNNNPGNIGSGAFANEHGAIGKAAGFAVFPNAAIGKSALNSLFDTSAYQSLTLNSAIARYAPPSENNTSAYQHFVQQYTGLSGNTSIDSLNPLQVNGITNAVLQFEGWRPGTVTTYHLGSAP